MDKTVVNSNKKYFKNENSITVKMDKLAKTLNHKDNNSKGKGSSEDLFRSCKKIYASQLSSSRISAPESPSY